MAFLLPDENDDGVDEADDGDVVLDSAADWHALTLLAGVALAILIELSNMAQLLLLLAIG